MIKNFCRLFFLLTAASTVFGQNRPKIALALGGGGALGYAHLGVIKVLEAQGIPVDIVTGTSIGALIGAFYALGYSSQQLLSILSDMDIPAVLDDARSRAYQPGNRKLRPHSSIAGFNFNESFKLQRSNAFLESRAIENFLDYSFWEAGRYARFADFPRPFACTATDLSESRRVVYRDGPLAEAVRASIAFPGFLEPVTKGDMLLVDGGVLGNLPVQEAFALGADVVITVSLNRPEDHNKNNKNVFDGLVKVLTRQGAIADAAAERAASVVISPNIDKASAFDFLKPKAIMRLGEEAALKALPQLKPYMFQNAVLLNRKPNEEPVYIDKVVFSGASAYEGLATALLDLPLPAPVSRQQVLAAARRVGHHSFFKQARFYYKGSNLHVDLESAAPYTVGIRAAFDSDFSFSGSGSFAVKRPGSFAADWYLDAGFKQGLNVYSFSSFFFESQPYLNFYAAFLVNDSLDGGLTAPNSSIFPDKEKPNVYYGEIGLGYEWAHKLYMELFYTVEYWSSRGIVNTHYDQKSGERISLLRFNAVIDQLDNAYFPSQGYKLAAALHAGVGPFSGMTQFFRFNLEAAAAVKLPWGFSLAMATQGGRLLGKNPPLNYYFESGGLYNEERRFALYGYPFGAFYGRSAWAFKGSLQYNFLFRFYALFDWNGLFSSEEEALSFTAANLHQSVGGRVAVYASSAVFETGLYWNFDTNNIYVIAAFGARL